MSVGITTFIGSLKVFSTLFCPDPMSTIFLSLSFLKSYRGAFFGEYYYLIPYKDKPKSPPINEMFNLLVFLPLAPIIGYNLPRFRFIDFSILSCSKRPFYKL